MKGFSLAAVVALAALAPLASQATTLSFDGAACSDQGTGSGALLACNTSTALRINQAYGDETFADLSWNGGGSGGVSMVFWADPEYSGLGNVAYGSLNETPVVTLAARAGGVITLADFQLGAYPNTSRSTRVVVRDLAGGFVFDSGAITVLGSTPSLFSINRSSSVGFSIAFDPDSQQLIAIDNIRFEAVSAVPEPASVALLALGLGAVAWAARSRRPGKAQASSLA